MDDDTLHVGPPREFAAAVRYHFAFLETTAFALHRFEPNLVEFVSDAVIVQITYGAFSGEVTTRIGPSATRQLYSDYEIALINAPESAREMRGGPVREPRQIEQRVTEQARWLQRYGDPALHNDAELFRQVGEARTMASHQYLDGVAASRLREKVANAWRAKDMVKVVASLRELEGLETVELKPSERSKLAFAERSIGR